MRLGLLALSLLIILAADVPWAAWQDHAHWERVGWIPFVSPPVRPIDIALNLTLFVPFGFFARKSTSRTWLVVAAGAALALACETLQVYSHGRFPSATDFVCNIVGTAAGAYLARGPRADGRPDTLIPQA